MAEGFRSPLFLLGLGEGPTGVGFNSPLFSLGLSAAATVTGGSTSFWGWWLGGFSGYATSTSSPWFFLKISRERRDE